MVAESQLPGPRRRAPVTGWPVASGVRHCHFVDESLARVAVLLRDRNAIDSGISRVINRPVTAGHLGEWIASPVFDIALEESAAAEGWTTTSSSPGRPLRPGPSRGLFRPLDLRAFRASSAKCQPENRIGILGLARSS